MQQPTKSIAHEPMSDVRASRTPRGLRWSAALLAGACLGAAASAAETPAAGGPVNVRLLAQQRAFAPVPYDTHPSFVVDASGRGVAAWHSYAAGNEWVVARALPAVRDALMTDVAGGRGVMTPPEIAADPVGATCVTWAAFANGRWHVMARRLQGGEGPAPVRLSAPEVNGLSLSEQVVVLHTAPGQATVPLEGTWFTNGFQGAMGGLLCAIEEKRTPTHDARRNLDSFALCFAAMASADAGEPRVPGEVKRVGE